MYFNVNFNVFFKLIKVHLLVSELYMYQNARCNDTEEVSVYNYILYHYCSPAAPVRSPPTCNQTSSQGIFFFYMGFIYRFLFFRGSAERKSRSVLTDICISFYYGCVVTMC